MPAPRWIAEVRADVEHVNRFVRNGYLKVVMDHNLTQDHFYAAYGSETRTPAYTLFHIGAGADFTSAGKLVLRQCHREQPDQCGLPKSPEPLEICTGQPGNRTAGNLQHGPQCQLRTSYPRQLRRVIRQRWQQSQFILRKIENFNLAPKKASI